MLTELRIKDFAIIDHLELDLAPGLVVFTGETGAGKSIIMDALNILLGGHTDTTVIRSDADQARVEATFILTGSEKAATHQILEREQLLDEKDYVFLSREVRREGRSVGRINGRAVSLSLLKELGETLVDIHGQTEHLSLLNVRAHLELLDRYANAGSLLASYQRTYQNLLKIRHELEQLRAARSDAERRAEMLTFQSQEIEAAKLKPNEDEELRKERDRLANAESLSNLAHQCLIILDEGTPESPACTDLVGQVVQSLTRLAQIDGSQTTLVDRTAVLEETLADLARNLRNYLEAVEFNPTRLEEVEERLDLIHRLERKYGNTIEAVLAFAADARQQLTNISTANERITELEGTETAVLEKLSAQGLALSQKRKEAAKQMSEAIETELNDLLMAEARFEVDFQMRAAADGLSLQDSNRIAFNENGLDKVEFLIAPNPGEGMKPLTRIASGGETSRLMLALKNVLAHADQIPTLIFDEIDQGIGGRVGATVGQKLWHLGCTHQVLVITHLPQLAVFGDQHFQVQKVIEHNRTLTRVIRLSGEPRTLELAQMLGAVSEGTLRSAHELLQSAQSYKADQKSP
jgi:DNA repair protein RecN (Recombination protein N)